MLIPIDGNDIPDETLKALENNEPIEPTVTGSEPSIKTPEPKAEMPAGSAEPKVPFHEDPTVQLYIERQVAKRVGEGNKAWEERLQRLEGNLTKPKVADTKIGGWEPGSEAERQAAKAIILQAKREMAEELQGLDRSEREKVSNEDREFSDFLGELRTTGTLKNDEDEIEFARLIAEYKLEDKDSAIKLWTKLQEGIAQAKENGVIEGTEEEKKKAQLAKVGSPRGSGEPGNGDRSYNERRSAEPNFDAIYNREMEKLGV